MSKEKQIEEMAKIIHGYCEAECLDGCYSCVPYKKAEALYEAGYRKQKEGEWIKKYDKAPRYVCSACNHLYNNKEYKYCPNCGAHMRKEDEGK